MLTNSTVLNSYEHKLWFFCYNIEKYWFFVKYWPFSQNYMVSLEKLQNPIWDILFFYMGQLFSRCFEKVPCFNKKHRLTTMYAPIDSIDTPDSNNIAHFRFCLCFLCFQRPQSQHFFVFPQMALFPPTLRFHWCLEKDLYVEHNIKK